MTEPPFRKLRTPEDHDRFRLSLVPIDQAFHASEQKWGVGRLERLVSPSTMAAYKRGWDAYRAAIEAGDAQAVEAIGPKMIAALAFMDAEATKAGHQPLAPDVWEHPMADGAVLVICRTGAEASAVLRASQGQDGASYETSGISYETTLPPDLAITVRNSHEGRALTVWTVAEVARLIERHGSVAAEGVKWDGTPAPSGVQLAEGAAADIVRSGYPLSEPLAGAAPNALLDF
jgi:hypothetical protein